MPPEAVNIDRATGAIDLGGGVILGPGTTHEGFVESALGRTSRPLIRNGEWRSYALAPVSNRGVSFHVAIYFHGQAVWMIELTNASEEFGESWDDWSPENEAYRREWHDRWLAETQGVVPGDFSWGSLSSMTDPKSGGSSIVLRFTRQERETSPRSSRNSL